MQICAAACNAPEQHLFRIGANYTREPKRSERVAMRTSMRNATNALHRESIDATNKTAIETDRSTATKALAKSMMTTIATSNAETDESAIALFI